MSRPESGTFSPFMEKYIQLANGSSITELIASHHQRLLDFYASIPEAKADYQYAPDKWTVKEVLSHVIDTDTVFAYRALVISRGEQQTLPGFDQDQFTENAEADQQSLAVLKEIFQTQRNYIKLLVSSFSNKQLARIGNVADYKLSVNAVSYALFGHALHHMQILKERYGL